MPSMNQSQSCKQCKEPPQCQQKCQQQPQPRCIQSQPKCQKPPQPRCIQSQPACPKQSQPRCIQSQPKCQQSQPKCQQSQPRCEEDADDAAACCPSKGPARGCPAPCGNERGRKCGAAPCRARTGGCGAPRNPCCPSPARPSSLRVNRAAQLCLPGGRSRLCLTRPTCNRMTGQDGGQCGCGCGNTDDLWAVQSSENILPAGHGGHRSQSGHRGQSGHGGQNGHSGHGGQNGHSGHGGQSCHSGCRCGNADDLWAVESRENISAVSPGKATNRSTGMLEIVSQILDGVPAGMNGNQGVCNGPSRDQLFRCCPKPRLKPPPSPISCDALCCNPCKFNSQTRGKKKRCRQAPSCCDCACNSKNR
ncbi:unnamed protein product [Bemisia tabaci]|uniref:Uncharacterized protein n=1 Tax=Bemisia tabaci TaxID=7038 RepID=A0A9P0G1L4_BEMTA|nr:unnamed protein product [Bemisia tabaci]